MFIVSNYTLVTWGFQQLLSPVNSSDIASLFPG